MSILKKRIDVLWFLPLDFILFHCQLGGFFFSLNLAINAFYFHLENWKSNKNGQKPLQKLFLVKAYMYFILIDVWSTSFFVFSCIFASHQNNGHWNQHWNCPVVSNKPKIIQRTEITSRLRDACKMTAISYGWCVFCLNLTKFSFFLKKKNRLLNSLLRTDRKDRKMSMKLIDNLKFPNNRTPVFGTHSPRHYLKSNL